MLPIELVRIWVIPCLIRRLVTRPLGFCSPLDKIYISIHNADFRSSFAIFLLLSELRDDLGSSSEKARKVYPYDQMLFLMLVIRPVEFCSPLDKIYMSIHSAHFKSHFTIFHLVSELIGHLGGSYEKARLVYPHDQMPFLMLVITVLNCDTS